MFDNITIYQRKTIKNSHIGSGTGP